MQHWFSFSVSKDFEVFHADELLNLGVEGTNLAFESTKEFDLQESEETQLNFSTLSSKDAHTNSEVYVSIAKEGISSTTQLFV